MEGDEASSSNEKQERLEIVDDEEGNLNLLKIQV